jgi:hypothetical protein
MGSAAGDTVRMLVLETDEPHPETMKHRGRFGEIIDRFFVDAGRKQYVGIDGRMTARGRFAPC